MYIVAFTINGFVLMANGYWSLHLHMPWFALFEFLAGGACFLYALKLRFKP